MDSLERAVRTVVRRCLGVGAGTNVLVIGDPGTRELAEALRAEAAGAGADAVLALRGCFRRGRGARGELSAQDDITLGVEVADGDGVRGPRRGLGGG